MKIQILFFIFSQHDQSLNVDDYYCSCSQGGEPPTVDQSLGGFDNILSFSGMQYLSSNGTQVTLIQFERNLVTNDTDFDNPISDEDLVFVFFFLFLF